MQLFPRTQADVRTFACCSQCGRQSGGTRARGRTAAWHTSLAKCDSDSSARLIRRTSARVAVVRRRSDGRRLFQICTARRKHARAASLDTPHPLPPQAVCPVRAVTHLRVGCASRLHGRLGGTPNSSPTPHSPLRCVGRSLMKAQERHGEQPQGWRLAFHSPHGHASRLTVRPGWARHSHAERRTETDLCPALTTPNCGCLGQNPRRWGPPPRAPPAQGSIVGRRRRWCGPPAASDRAHFSHQHHARQPRAPTQTRAGRPRESPTHAGRSARIRCLAPAQIAAQRLGDYSERSVGSAARSLS